MSFLPRNPQLHPSEWERVGRACMLLSNPTSAEKAHTQPPKNVQNSPGQSQVLQPTCVVCGLQSTLLLTDKSPSISYGNNCWWFHIALQLFVGEKTNLPLGLKSFLWPLDSLYVGFHPFLVPSLQSCLLVPSDPPPPHGILSRGEELWASQTFHTARKDHIILCLSVDMIRIIILCSLPFLPNPHSVTLHIYNVT